MDQSQGSEPEAVPGNKRRKQEPPGSPMCREGEQAEEQPGVSAFPSPTDTASHGGGIGACHKLYMPQQVLYQIVKQMGFDRDSSCELLPALLRTCKTWRSTVQGALETLSLGKISQVSMRKVQMCHGCPTSPHLETVNIRYSTEQSLHDW